MGLPRKTLFGRIMKAIYIKKNSSVISLSFLGLFLLAGCAGFSEDRKLEDVKADYQLQERCGQKSEAFFKEKYGNGIFNDGKRIVTYQNHYNKKLKKCLIILNTNYFSKNINKGYKEKFLLDVNYKRSYGFFHNSGAFTFCDVEKNRCNSEEEWVSLVKPYMEE
jgi:hypothetical protein